MSAQLRWPLWFSCGGVCWVGLGRSPAAGRAKIIRENTLGMHCPSAGRAETIPRKALGWECISPQLGVQKPFGTIPWECIVPQLGVPKSFRETHWECTSLQLGARKPFGKIPRECTVPQLGVPNSFREMPWGPTTAKCERTMGRILNEWVGTCAPDCNCPQLELLKPFGDALGMHLPSAGSVDTVWGNALGTHRRGMRGTAARTNAVSGHFGFPSGIIR